MASLNLLAFKDYGIEFNPPGPIQPTIRWISI